MLGYEYFGSWTLLPLRMHNDSGNLHVPCGVVPWVDKEQSREGTKSKPSSKMQPKYHQLQPNTTIINPKYS